MICPKCGTQMEEVIKGGFACPNCHKNNKKNNFSANNINKKYELLIKLQGLRESGAINEEEFKKEKTTILKNDL